MIDCFQCSVLFNGDVCHKMKLFANSKDMQKRHLFRELTVQPQVDIQLITTYLKHIHPKLCTLQD